MTTETLDIADYNREKEALEKEIAFFKEGLAGARFDLQALNKKYKVLLEPEVTCRRIDIVYDIAKEMDGEHIEKVCRTVALRINRSERTARSYVNELAHREWAYIIDEHVLINGKRMDKVAFRGAIKDAVLELLKTCDSLNINEINESLPDFNKHQIGQALKNLVANKHCTTQKGVANKGYKRYSINGAV